MSILEVPSEAEATGLTADIYQGELRSLGHIPAHTKVVSLNPEAYLAWEALTRAISSSLGLRRYELVTLAAAQALGSRHCRLAHGKKILKVLAEDQLKAIARDFHDAGLSPAEVAMMDFAVKLSTDAAAMTENDSMALRDLGFTDREIVDITLAAAARNLFSRALLALAVDVDVPEGLHAGLREALLAPLPAPDSRAPGGSLGAQ